jgi:hypothetical protein
MDHTRIMVYRRRVNSLDKGMKPSQEFVWIAYPGTSSVDELTQARRGLVVSGTTASNAVANLEDAIAARNLSL